jgi:hypothetical protein
MDNLTESDSNDHQDVAPQANDTDNPQIGTATPMLEPANENLIIWTPRFIISFFLVLVIGLSGATVLTTGYLNRYYLPGWLLIGYTVVNLGGWISVSICTRSSWVRLGSAFGCLWAIMMSFIFALNLFPPTIDAHATFLTNAMASASSALLACYICLSTAWTPFKRWDRIFFIIAPIIGTILVVILLIYTSEKMQSSFLLKMNIITVELWFCTAIWWLRPSCWRTQPGPAFLLGIVPIIQILLLQPLNTYNEKIVFFSQVMLLSTLLGSLRILQSEIRHRLPKTPHQ